MRDRARQAALLGLAVAGLLALARPAGADAVPQPDIVDDSQAPAPAADAPGLVQVPIRSGSHETFGRVVFDLPPGATATAAEEDGVLVVRLYGAVPGAAPRPPRNVTDIAVTGGEVRILVAPHAVWLPVQLLGRFVVDVSDPPPSSQAASLPVKVAGIREATPEPPPPPPAPPRARHLWSGPPPRPRQPRATAAAAPMPRVITPDTPMPAMAPSKLAQAKSEPAKSEPAKPEPPKSEPTTAEMAKPAMATPDLAKSDTAEPEPAKPDMANVAPPPGPVAIVAAAPVGGAIALPFAAGTGAAAFRRNGETVVVFDERRPLDLAALKDDPVFASARVEVLPAATVLRLTLPEGEALTLARVPSGWSLSRVPFPPRIDPIGTRVGDAGVLLAAAGPSAVVSVPDPQTGEALQVGTQKAAGQGVVVTRRTPDFTLLATFMGVALEPASDALTLRIAPMPEVPRVTRIDPRHPPPPHDDPVSPGFVVNEEGGDEAGRRISLDAVDAEALAAEAAAHLTRKWDFPNLAVAPLERRLQAATMQAGKAPPQSRAAARLSAAQALLSLGLGAEAEAVAQLAATDDARAAEDPEAAALQAVAALLAGRLEETDALADPRVTGTDEIALWRAVRAATLHEGAPDAAATFAATMPLMLDYPQALRDRLLPLAAETMAQGGERAAAKRLVDARPDDHALDYARALLADADGHADAALALLDTLALSPDRKMHARAAVRAVDVRLRAGQLTPAQGADALEKLMYAWRGDGTELAVRLRVAALRSQAGNWRAALALLRESSQGDIGQSWADQLPAIRARMTQVFTDALAQDAQKALPPLELVAMVEENPDLLPDGEAGRALAARVAERLGALDLPKRAEPVLEKLLTATQPGAARAELGARLAALRLEDGDAPGALTALSDSAFADLPAALTENRTIVFARATAARGSLAPATAALAALDTASADDARAGLFEQAKDWKGATEALSSLASRVVPPDGPLGDAPARTLLRLASAAAQAGDEALLARLREHDAARMPDGKIGEMFRVLTESPVQGVGDLNRAAQEASLARNLPAALKSLSTTR